MAKQKLVRSDVCLTLHPPETPPVHLAALPGWTPGPGSFHCGTAGGHSRQAAGAEDTVSHRLMRKNNAIHGVR